MRAKPDAPSLPAAQYVEARKRRDDAHDVGAWLGATGAPADVIAAQERVLAVLDALPEGDLHAVRRLVDRYGRIWAKDTDYYAAAKAVGICSCGGIDAVPGTTDHTSDCGSWGPRDV